MVNPFLVPPRFVLRALDDLHSLALAAERLPAFENFALLGGPPKWI